MRRFCSVCGKSTENLYEGGLCKECYLKEHEFISLPEILETTVCKRCFRQYVKGRWQKNAEEFEHALNHAAVNEINHSIKTTLVNAKVDIVVEELKEHSKGRFDVICKVIVEGDVDGAHVKEEKFRTVRVILQLCSDCSRLSGGYYQAIFQIRGGVSLSDDEVDKLSDETTSLMANYSGEKLGFISKVERLKEGVDFYLGSAKIARKVSHALKRKYGGELLESAKLVGRTDSGKDEYRITIVLRLPKIKIKDIIEVNGRIIQVLSLGGNKLSGFDLKTRSKSSFPLAKTKDAKIIAGKEDIKKGIVSEVTPKEIQIIDMESYKTFNISWTKKGLKSGLEIEFLKNGGVYLLMLDDEA